MRRRRPVHWFFSPDVCYEIGKYLNEFETRVFSLVLGTEPALYCANNIPISRENMHCSICSRECWGKFLCSNCKALYGRLQVPLRLQRLHSQLLAIGNRYCSVQKFPDFSDYLSTLPRVCAGFAYAPAEISVLTNLLDDQIRSSRARIFAEFHLEISCPILRGVFSPQSLGDCTSGFARLVLKERQEISDYAGMQQLAKNVGRCLRRATLRELESEIFDTTRISDLAKRKLMPSSPALDLDEEISDQSAGPRFRVPLGTLRGRVIDENLVISDSPNCRALVNNENFKKKFPIEWRELKRLLLVCNF